MSAAHTQEGEGDDRRRKDDEDEKRRKKFWKQDARPKEYPKANEPPISKQKGKADCSPEQRNIKDVSASGSHGFRHSARYVEVPQLRLHGQTMALPPTYPQEQPQTVALPSIHSQTQPQVPGQASGQETPSAPRQTQPETQGRAVGQTQTGRAVQEQTAAQAGAQKTAVGQARASPDDRPEAAERVPSPEDSPEHQPSISIIDYLIRYNLATIGPDGRLYVYGDESDRKVLLSGYSVPDNLVTQSRTASSPSRTSEQQQKSPFRSPLSQPTSPKNISAKSNRHPHVFQKLKQVFSHFKEKKPSASKSKLKSGLSVEKDQTTEISPERPQEGSSKTSPRTSEDGPRQGSPKKPKGGFLHRSSTISGATSPSGSPKKSNETPPNSAPQSPASPVNRFPKKRRDSPMTQSSTAGGSRKTASPPEEPTSPNKSPWIMRGKSSKTPGEKEGGSQTGASPAEVRALVWMTQFPMSSPPRPSTRRPLGRSGSGRAGSFIHKVRLATSSGQTGYRAEDTAVPSPGQGPSEPARGSQRRRRRSESDLHDVHNEPLQHFDEPLNGPATAKGQEKKLYFIIPLMALPDDATLQARRPRSNTLPDRLQATSGPSAWSAEVPQSVALPPIHPQTQPQAPGQASGQETPSAPRQTQPETQRRAVGQTQKGRAVQEQTAAQAGAQKTAVGQARASPDDRPEVAERVPSPEDSPEHQPSISIIAYLIRYNLVTIGPDGRLYVYEDKSDKKVLLSGYSVLARYVDVPQLRLHGQTVALPPTHPQEQPQTVALPSIHSQTQPQAPGQASRQETPSAPRQTQPETQGRAVGQTQTGRAVQEQTAAQAGAQKTAVGQAQASPDDRPEAAERVPSPKDSPEHHPSISIIDYLIRYNLATIGPDGRLYVYGDESERKVLLSGYSVPDNLVTQSRTASSPSQTSEQQKSPFRSPLSQPTSPKNISAKSNRHPHVFQKLKQVFSHFKEKKPSASKSKLKSGLSVEKDQTTEISPERPQEGSSKTSPRKSEDGPRQGSPKKPKDGFLHRSSTISSATSSSGYPKKSNETPPNSPPQPPASPVNRFPKKRRDSPMTQSSTAGGSRKAAAPPEEPSSPNKSPWIMRGKSSKTPGEKDGGSQTGASPAEVRAPVWMTQFLMSSPPRPSTRRPLGRSESGRAGSFIHKVRLAISSGQTGRRAEDTAVPSPGQGPSELARGSQRPRLRSESDLHDAHSEPLQHFEEPLDGPETAKGQEEKLSFIRPLMELPDDATLRARRPRSNTLSDRLQSTSGPSAWSAEVPQTVTLPPIHPQIQPQTVALPSIHSQTQPQAPGQASGQETPSAPRQMQPETRGRAVGQTQTGRAVQEQAAAQAGAQKTAVGQARASPDDRPETAERVPSPEDSPEHQPSFPIIDYLIRYNLVTIGPDGRLYVYEDKTGRNVPISEYYFLDYATQSRTASSQSQTWEQQHQSPSGSPSSQPPSP